MLSLLQIGQPELPYVQTIRLQTLTNPLAKYAESRKVNGHGRTRSSIG